MFSIDELQNKGEIKFVVLLTPQNTVLLQANLHKLIYHEEIVNEYINTTGEPVICIGGGKIMVTDTEVLCFGTSTKYGPANALIVKQLVNELLNGRRLELMLYKY